MNLAATPDLAKKYNINTSALSRQLPTLIMFENGKEVNRFPPYDDDTKRYMKVNKYSKVYYCSNSHINTFLKKDIAKYFDLQERYLATRFNADKKKPGNPNKNTKTP